MTVREMKGTRIVCPCHAKTYTCVLMQEASVSRDEVSASKHAGEPRAPRTKSGVAVMEGSNDCSCLHLLAAPLHVQQRARTLENQLLLR